MKQDYEFIKRIFEIIENYESYQVPIEYIQTALNIQDASSYDKLLGHFELCSDLCVLECCNVTDSPDAFFGISHTLDGVGFCQGASYRITAQGFDFYNALKDDTIMAKIKHYAFGVALNVGQQLLIKKLAE